jgi:hypothetical protein
MMQLHKTNKGLLSEMLIIRSYLKYVLNPLFTIYKPFGTWIATKHIFKQIVGLMLLVGENDSGKSAILDAIKIVLGTTCPTVHGEPSRRSNHPKN